MISQSRVSAIGGVPANIDSYAVFASTASDLLLFLVDEAGKTFASYTVTVPTTAGGTTLASLVNAISAQATLDWGNAAGAILRVDGDNTVYFNTSVDASAGTIAVAVAATSPFSWTSGETDAIGFVSTTSGFGGAGSSAASSGSDFFAEWLVSTRATLVAATSTKLIAAPNAGRTAVRVTNQGTDLLYLREVAVGAGTPDFLSGADFDDVLVGGATATVRIGPGFDIYGYSPTAQAYRATELR